MSLIFPLVLVVLFGALAITVALVALHVLPTGLSPLRDPVSQYALTRFGAGYRAATIAAAVTGAAAAVLIAVAYSGIAAVITVALLVFFSLARALIGFFPMDAPLAARSTSGAVHGVLAFSAFGSITAAAFVAAGVFHDNGQPTLATVSTIIGVVMSIGAIGMLLTSRSASRQGFGAFERLIYLGFLAWFFALAITSIV